jgi:hypothetical protein
MSYGLAYTPYNTNLFLNNSGSFPVFDPDAMAFIAAANIIDMTQQSAINNLVVSLKASNIWDKMKAIYPFVGGTAFSHKFNLKDPRDLDVAFRLVFSGGWIHDSNGVIPNGINAYADTKYIASVNNNSTDYSSLSFYSKTNSITSAIQVEMGASQFSSPTGAFALFASFNDVGQNASFQSDFPNAFPYNYWSVAAPNTNTTGFYCGSAGSGNIDLYKDGILLAQNTSAKVSTRTSPTIPLIIGADNYNGVPRRYSVKNCAFAHIGATLDNSAAVNLYDAVQHFQTDLSRQV